MHKRGLSGVVVALILVLLALVATGIIWVVIKNVIEKGAEDISLESFFLDLQIQKVKIEDNGDIKITVKRGSGAEKANVSAIAFIISDGENSKTIKRPTTLEALGYETFIISSSEFADIGFVKEISIAPGIISETGKEKFGKIVDKETFSTKQILENLRAISWWKFDGDARDKIGGNHGTLQGNINCNVRGRFGNSCEFFQKDASGNYIEDYIELSSEIQYNTPWTVCSWVYLKENFADKAQVFLDDSDLTIDHYSIRFSMHNNTKIGFTDYLVKDYYFNYELPVKEWKFVCYMGNLSGIYLYVDGQFKDKNPDIIKLPVKYIAHSPLRSNATSGTPHGTIGIIDEVMIFNKTLNEKKIKALYELDLS